jgi:hypothetical protein
VTATPVSQVVMANPVNPAVTPSSMSASDQCLISAHARLMPDPPDPPDPPETMDSPEMPEALATMDVPVALENPDLVATPVSPDVPAHPANLETPVPPVLVVPLPLVALESPDVLDPRDLPASLETPAKLETTVPPAALDSLVDPVSPVNLVNPDSLEMLETTVVKEDATTAHLLVWLLAIKPFSDKIFPFGKRVQRFSV